MENTHENNKKYFFLVSLPRSGSTLLAYVLNSHSKIRFEHEDNNKPFVKKDSAIFYNLQWKIVHGFKEYLKSFLTEKEYLITSRYSYKKQIKWIFDSLGNGAKFIILKRKFMWRIFYRYNNEHVIVPLWLINKFLICRNYIKSNFDYIQVNYNDLVSKPSKVFSEITKFIGVNFESEILNYQNFDHSNLIGRGNVKTIIFKGIVDKSNQERGNLKLVYDAIYFRLLRFIRYLKVRFY